MKRLLEGLVAHPGAAKGDAAYVCLRILQRRPGRPCTQQLSMKDKMLSSVGSRCFQDLIMPCFNAALSVMSVQAPGCVLADERGLTDPRVFNLFLFSLQAWKIGPLSWI